MGKPETTPSDELTQETKISEVSIVSMNAAFQRARALDSLRITQDILYRVALLFLLSAYMFYPGRWAAFLVVVLFCAMWQISKIRLLDAVSQIEDSYITGAQDAFESVAETTKWEQLLIILGSRLTSRRDIVAMERVLQFEPSLWGALAILVIIVGWS